MHKLNAKKLLSITIMLVSVLCISLVAHADSYPTSEIRSTVVELASTDAPTKQQALTKMDTYGSAAIPVYLEMMQQYRLMEHVITYELVSYAEKFGVEGLPIISEGLNNVSAITRRRAARAAISLGEDAAPLTTDLANIAANIGEASDIRSTAVDALKAIKVSTPEVSRGVSLALVGDPMMAWRVAGAMSTLDISYDQAITTLLKELGTQEHIYLNQIVIAINRNIKNTINPLELLAQAFATVSEERQEYLLSVSEQLYQEPKISSRDVSELLFTIAKTSSIDLSEQVIYLLGEHHAQDPEIVTNLLELAADQNTQVDLQLFVLYALEKAAPDNQAVISRFISALTDSNSDDETRQIAARYLEKSDLAAYPKMLVLFEHIDQYDETTLWRLAPLFVSVANQEPHVLEKIKGLSSQNSFLQIYSQSLLTALGAITEPTLLSIEKAAEHGDKTPAFPTAEGYGRYTVGGRGGQVYVVTNLNDRGAGSFREAVDARGPRTVVFAVSGNIMLSEAINISNPYITIAGQTAPGEGITIAGAPININTSQVIIRYLRIRMGDYNNIEADSIGGRYISDVILDHISASWSTDECVSFYEVDNVTVQWSFITESLRASAHIKGNHGYGGIWGGFASFHHNLLAHHSSRNPRFDAERTTDDPATDMRNNVIYNWGFNSSYGGEGGNHNMIANYYKAGPATRAGSMQYKIIEASPDGSWYVEDNYVYGHPAITADNWAGGVQPRVGKVPDMRAYSEHPVPEVTTHSAEVAFELVLADAGVTLPMRDEVDTRIAEEVRTGTATYGGASTGPGSGIIDSQEDVGGLPFIRGYSAPLDSDQDGIPDWWLIKYGLDPKTSIDPAGDLDGDGYTNIEEYLNNTNPLKPDLY